MELLSFVVNFVQISVMSTSWFNTILIHAMNKRNETIQFVRCHKKRFSHSNGSTRLGKAIFLFVKKKLKELCTSQWQRIWKSKTLLIYHILFFISIYIRNEQLNFSGNTGSVHISTMASAYISLLITYPECCWIRTKPKVDIHLELNSHTLLKV